MSVVVAVALAATALGACGGKPEGCLSVDPSVAQAIVDGAKGADLTVRSNTGQAIKALSGVYYVAFKVRAAGSDETAVWAVDDLRAPGGIRSVDGYAQQFTNWPVLDGANGSDKARDAEACLD
jgi:hypothetical protein